MDDGIQQPLPPTFDGPALLGGLEAAPLELFDAFDVGVIALARSRNERPCLIAHDR